MNRILLKGVRTGRYAYYEFNLLQPVEQVEKIERLSPMNRHMQQNSSGESFASLFKKAAQRHEANQKYNSNTFDKLC